MRQTAALAKSDRCAFDVYADPSAPPLAQTELKPVNLHAKQPLQSGHARSTGPTEYNILQRVESVNKRLPLSPNSLVAAEKENFDPVRKQLAVYRRTANKAKPLEEKGAAMCDRDARPPLVIRPGSEQVDGSVGSSRSRIVPSTPTSRVLASRGAHHAAGNAVVGTSPTTKAKALCTTSDEKHLPPPARGRPGRSMSVAVVTDQPKRPAQSRKTSSTAAGGAGVDDLVHLLGSMGVVHPNSKIAARVAQLQGMRRPQQHTEMPGCWPQHNTTRISKAPELRLNVPRHLSKPERQPSLVASSSIDLPRGLRPDRTPQPANKPSSKQNKLLSSAMLTPPELRKSIR
ncbi:hypothetical protein GGF44_004390 [Coemansia sp. RSA 1694]|nr:hypothetical protein GGF44_004390 [Coemansia sp. RSA 1694]